MINNRAEQNKHCTLVVSNKRKPIESGAEKL